MDSEKILDDLCMRYASLEPMKNAMKKAYSLLLDTASRHGVIFTCGNGGSSADADHIVGELMKSFVKKRPVTDSFAKRLVAVDPILGEKLIAGLEGAIPAVNLSQHTALTTAFSNDKAFSLAFAQQLSGYGHEGDSLIAISTSGNSEDVVLACVVAKAMGIHVVGLTGKKPSQIEQLADVTIKAPEVETYKVQEYHLPLYHCLCLMLENAIWPDETQR